MHIASPASPDASNVVAGDDLANCVAQTYPNGCVSPVERTKGKAYLTFLGSHDLMGKIPKINHRYSTNQKSISVY